MFGNNISMALWGFNLLLLTNELKSYCKKQISRINGKQTYRFSPPVVFPSVSQQDFFFNSSFCALLKLNFCFRILGKAERFQAFSGLMRCTSQAHPESSWMPSSGHIILLHVHLIITPIVLAVTSIIE